jgi:hypothetical protein
VPVAGEHRVQALQRLLDGEPPLDATIEAVGALPWDSDEELVTLAPEHVVGMLERFLSGELTSGDLERWANAIEGRDDIGLDTDAADALKEVMFELANPSIQGPTTVESARAWVGRIRSCG